MCVQNELDTIINGYLQIRKLFSADIIPFQEFEIIAATLTGKKHRQDLADATKFCWHLL